MPQMMPMNWILMFLTLNTLILIMTTNMFFFTKYNPHSHQQLKIKTMMQPWTW